MAPTSSSIIRQSRRSPSACLEVAIWLQPTSSINASRLTSKGSVVIVKIHRVRTAGNCQQMCLPGESVEHASDRNAREGAVVAPQAGVDFAKRCC